MFEDLKGQRVLITGASGAIGGATARLFASYGAAVGLHYHESRREAEALGREIIRQGGEAAEFHADLRQPVVCRKLLQAFLRRFRGIDVLINNAGAVIGSRHFLSLRELEWNATVALNATAPFFLAQHTFRHMRRRRGGRIINISSIAAEYGGSPQTLHYGAAKAALDAVTVGLARAGAPHRILVNSIRAGFIETPFHQKIGRHSTNDRVNRIPLKRAGQPLDIARMALFLASDAGAFITGEIFTVAGGD